MEFDFDLTFDAGGRIPAAWLQQPAPEVCPQRVPKFDFDLTFTNVTLPPAAGGGLDRTRPVLGEFDLDIRMAGMPVPQMAGPPNIPRIPTQGDTCRGTCVGETCQGVLCGGVTGVYDCPNVTHHGGLSCATCHGASCDEPCGQTATCYTCDPALITCGNQHTCGGTCGWRTCETCATNCGQATCAQTCQTCQTQCHQHTCVTCATCQTNCDQHTCGFGCTFLCTFTCGDSCGITCGESCNLFSGCANCGTGDCSDGCSADDTCDTCDDTCEGC
jgi:hypothetical protein